MSEQRPLLGGVLAGKVLEIVIGKALDRVAKSPSISLQPPDVPAVTDIVARTVKEELASREAHATNAEPAYQSRVAQGSIASVLGAVALIAQLWTDGIENSPQDYVPSVVVLIGALWSLYGRFVASKPFGA